MAHLCKAYGVSELQAFAVLQAECSSAWSQTIRVDDADQYEEIKPISKEFRRFAYRRILLMLLREGNQMKHNTLKRI